jgi:hypothetical protein
MWIFTRHGFSVQSAPDKVTEDTAGPSIATASWFGREFEAISKP